MLKCWKCVMCLEMKKCFVLIALLWHYQFVYCIALWQIFLFYCLKHKSTKLIVFRHGNRQRIIDHARSKDFSTLMPQTLNKCPSECLLLLRLQAASETSSRMQCRSESLGCVNFFAFILFLKKCCLDDVVDQDRRGWLICRNIMITDRLLIQSVIRWFQRV